MDAGPVPWGSAHHSQHEGDHRSTVDLSSWSFISRSIAVAAFSVFIWDVLCNLFGDYKLLQALKYYRGHNFQTYLYFFSRVFTTAYVTLRLVFTTTVTTHAPSGCRDIYRTLVSLDCLAAPSAYLLLFLNLRSILFVKSSVHKFILRFTFFFWIIVFAAYVSVIPSYPTVPPLPSGRCRMNENAQPYFTARLVAGTMYVLVIMAILLSKAIRAAYDNAQDENLPLRKTIFPALAGHQLGYHTLIFLTNVGSAIYFYVFIHGTEHHTEFIVISTVVANIVSSRIYREAEMGTQTIFPGLVTTTHSAGQDLGRIRGVGGLDGGHSIAVRTPSSRCEDPSDRTISIVVDVPAPRTDSTSTLPAWPQDENGSVGNGITEVPRSQNDSHVHSEGKGKERERPRIWVSHTDDPSADYPPPDSSFS